MMVDSPASPAVLLDWDSRFWGLRIGRTTLGSVIDQQQQLDQWIRDHDVGCLYLRCPDGGLPSLETATGFGFQLMESRVEYELTLRHAPPPRNGHIRPVQASDIPRLSDIARTAHRDSRFYADPNFPDDRCDDLFVAWIVNSCCHDLADWVLVADVDGQPRGYVTGRRDAGGAGHIGLIAVAEAARNRGLGGSLLAAAAARFMSDGVSTIAVATQARNHAANRLYRRHGFAQKALSHDLHWWRDSDPAMGTSAQ